MSRTNKGTIVKKISCINCGSIMEVEETVECEERPQFITSEYFVHQNGVCPNCGFIHNTASDYEIQGSLF